LATDYFLKIVPRLLLCSQRYFGVGSEDVRGRAQPVQSWLVLNGFTIGVGVFGCFAFVFGDLLNLLFEVYSVRVVFFASGLGAITIFFSIFAIGSFVMGEDGSGRRE
jgi:hypothetical protein